MKLRTLCQAGAAAAALVCGSGEAVWSQEVQPPAQVFADYEPAFGENAWVRPVTAQTEAAQPAPVVTDSNDPRWTLRAGAMFLHRSRPGSQAIVSNGFLPASNTRVDANDFSFRHEAGWELSAIRHGVLGTNWDVEARFFRVDGWNAPQDAGTGFGAVVRYDTPVGLPLVPAEVTAGYRSELNNVEVNLRRELLPYVTGLMGVRYVGLNEQLDITADYNLLFFSVESDHDIRARNHLTGFQMGLEAELLTWGPFSIEGLGKAGIYGNQASNRARVVNSIGPDFESRARRNHTAFVGELAVTGVIAVTNNLNVRSGYQMFWLDGVATASRQVASSDPLFGTASVHTKSTLFYHGAFVGLEYTR